METALVIKGKDGNSDVTTSFIISSVFGKRHSDVLRDIGSLSCSKEFHKRNFAYMFIIRNIPNQGKRNDPYYEISKDGFSFLVMGYTGNKASEYKELFISEFNKRDSLLKNDDYIMARAHEIAIRKMNTLEAQILIKDKQLEIAQEAIKEAAPKVEYFDEVLQAKEGITTTIIAKDLGMSAYSLNKLLHKYGVIYQSQKTWVLYTKYADRGYTVTKTFTHKDSNDNTVSEIQTYWTEAGRKFIMDGVKKIRNGEKF